MKKLILIAMILSLTTCAIAQDWISNGENMSSVRAKLNGLKSRVDTVDDGYDTINNRIDSLQMQVDSLVADTTPVCANMYGYDGHDVDTILIDEDTTYNLITGMLTNTIGGGCTFIAGSWDTITAMELVSPGLVKITMLDHGFRDEATISIRGTTDYNGVYVFDSISADEGYIIANWVSDQSGYADAGSTLKVSIGGTYYVSFDVSGRPISADVLFSFKMYVGATESLGLMSDTYYKVASLVSLGASGLVNLSAGAELVIGVANKTNATDYIITHIGVTLFKL